MAIRLSAVAKNLRGSEERNRSGIHDFFTQAGPFRDYKAEMAGAGQEDGRFELALSDEGWRFELLESARRGQEVEVFLTTHQARVVQLPTIGD